MHARNASGEKLPCIGTCTLLSRTHKTKALVICGNAEHAAHFAAQVMITDYLDNIVPEQYQASTDVERLFGWLT